MTETIEETSQNETKKTTWGNIDEHTSMRAMKLKGIIGIPWEDNHTKPQKPN